MALNAFCYQLSKEMAILAHSKEDRHLALADTDMGSFRWGIDNLDAEAHNAGEVRIDGLGSWEGNEG
jgi:hypothetical protein